MQRTVASSVPRTTPFHAAQVRALYPTIANCWLLSGANSVAVRSLGVAADARGRIHKETDLVLESCWGLQGKLAISGLAIANPDLAPTLREAFERGGLVPAAYLCSGE